MKRVAAIVGMMRPWNCAALGLLYLGMIRTSGDEAQWFGVGLAGSLAWALAAAAGYCWNDIYDVEVDRIGHPDRALPAGRLSIRGAVGVGGGLTVGAIALAAGVGWDLAAMVVSALVASWLYSGWLRKRSALGANLLCAAMVAAVPLSTWKVGPGTAAAVGSYALALTMVREALKDVLERDADSLVRPRPTLFRLSNEAVRWCCWGAIGLLLVLGSWVAFATENAWGVFLSGVSVALGVWAIVLVRPGASVGARSSQLLKAAAYMLTIAIWSAR